ncbi:MAG TPA: M23 family metallopeptidase, partial [Candidatus Woesebacteria bacterium]|nr:M23 family metallopeptidase [Candidatus Woesebacteria bacterium]
HGSGRKSLYAHFSKIAVKEGQTVEKDTVIGFIGSTGWSTGPHLHLEIMENGQKINPKALFEEYFGKKLASSR